MPLVHEGALAGDATHEALGDEVLERPPHGLATHRVLLPQFGLRGQWLAIGVPVAGDLLAQPVGDLDVRAWAGSARRTHRRSSHGRTLRE